MKYIRATPNPSGAYPAPQSNPFPGSIALTDEQAATLIQYNGFVSIERSGDTVTVTPNAEAWEAWKASLPADSAPPPTAEEDRDAMLVDHEYRLTLLELGVTEEV